MNRSWANLCRPVAISACAAFLLLGPGAETARASEVVSQTLGAIGVVEKVPRLSGDWLVWTADASTLDSRGRIVLHHRPSGQEYDLGPGFLPDVDSRFVPADLPGSKPTVSLGAGAAPGPVAGPGSGGAAGSVPLPLNPKLADNVHVAWVRWNTDDTLDVMRADLEHGALKVKVVAVDAGVVEVVRVLGPVTVWTGQDQLGGVSVFAHEGRTTGQVSNSGHAFRPDLARDALGRIWLAWDAYLGGPDLLEYEIFLAGRLGPGQWSTPQNLSQAPGAADLAVSLAADHEGGLWLAWQTDRGHNDFRIFVAHLDAVGKMQLPAPHPPSADPAKRGLVDLKVLRNTLRPRLTVDASGRPWLFATERVQQGGSNPFSIYEKQIRYAVYEGSVWQNRVLVSDNPLGDVEPDVERQGQHVAMVWQQTLGDVAPPVTFDVQVAFASVEADTGRSQPLLFPQTVAPSPALPHGKPLLPENRSLTVNGVPYRLIFADFHSHTRHSPDGMGELDQALFHARDVARLDAWAVVDHDTGPKEPRLDWEYEWARRIVALFDSPDFAAFIGFEWTNQLPFMGEQVGHRASFDSRKLFRHSDPSHNELSEFYAAMTAEDAIGVPHHLGKPGTGGATFQVFDPFVQPVTEVSSVHGIYENELVDKLLNHPVRFGVTAAGDDHNAKPGKDGLAGIWMLEGPLTHEAIKAALRARRTFAVKRDGAWFDFRLEGQPLGSELVHDGPLLLEYAFDEVPGSGTMTISLVRNGESSAPVYQCAVLGGLPTADQVQIPACAGPAFYMLRVTKGTGTLPKDTVLWSTPIWVDPTPSVP